MKTEALLTPHLLATLQPKDKEYTVNDAGTPGLAVRVQPTGARSWITRERCGGTYRRITLGQLEDMTLKEARAAFKRRGAAGAAAPVPKVALTFRALTRKFLAAKAGVYRPRTLSCLGAYLDAQLLPAFGKTPLDRITTPDVAAWFHGYSRVRPGGANQALTHFTTILNWGKSEGVVPHAFPNPAQPIRRNRRAMRGQMLSRVQLARLFAVLTDPPARCRDAARAIELILLTGCRSGEILRLRWDEVKRDRLCLARTKTGPRTVLLSNLARQRIEALRAHRSSPYVFPSPAHPSRPRAHVTGAWTTLKAIADLPDNLRLHNLRHTYASHAILAGESLFSTGKLLGHRKTQSTERYAHLDGTALARAADRVSKKIDLLMNDA